MNNKSFSQKFTSKIDNLKNRAYKFWSALVTIEISRLTHALASMFSSQSIDTLPLFPSLLSEALEFYLRFWKKNTFYKNCTRQCSLYKYLSLLKYINPNRVFTLERIERGESWKRSSVPPLSPPITLSSTQGALEIFWWTFSKRATWVLKLQAIFMITMGYLIFRCQIYVLLALPLIYLFIQGK